jgi:hypothetical protein
MTLANVACSPHGRAVPVLYAVCLWASRGKTISRSPTLSRATAFLTADYRPGIFWWEPVDMCRKLVLTGEKPRAGIT